MKVRRRLIGLMVVSSGRKKNKMEREKKGFLSVNQKGYFP